MEKNDAFSRWEHMMIHYGFYHQKPVNLITHFIGVPIIVMSVFIPLTWLQLSPLELSGRLLPVNFGLAAALALGLYYISLDRVLGWFSVPFLVGLWYAASLIGAEGAGSGSAVALSGFFGGFALQFAGHALEGKKPALMAYNPLIAMITSPLFVAAELAAALHVRRDMFDRVAREVRRLEMQGGIVRPQGR